MLKIQKITIIISSGDVASTLEAPLSHFHWMQQTTVQFSRVDQYPFPCHTLPLQLTLSIPFLNI